MYHHLPNLNFKSFDICEREITEKSLIIALKSIPNGKPTGHGGFYFINSLKQSKIDGHLSISQRQAIIKLIAKKDRDKTDNEFRYLMLTQKYFLKLKHVLPELISSNQTAYVKNRCISESGGLISDVIEMCNILDIPGYFITMDTEKAVDSLDHDFLLSVLKKLDLVKI